MSGSLVSVLIPCHNAERWIGTAVSSALAQRGVEVEVIVIDDGSNDRSRQILAEFGNRISVRHQQNAGSNTTRNLLLHLARGEWIQYLDADDYILPNKVVGQLQVASADEAIDVVYGPLILEYHRSSGIQSIVEKPLLPHDPWTELAAWRLGQTGALLLRREALLQVGAWRENQSCCQDYELYLRLLMAGATFRYAENEAAVYRRFETGTLSTKNLVPVWLERLKIEEQLESYLRVHDMLTEQRQLAINQARFETARSAWHVARKISLEACAAIRLSGAPFTPSGSAAPAGYRAFYRCFGFSVAEHIADTTRSIRRVFA
jgi:GT2 family glycosyltransferase